MSCCLNVSAYGNANAEGGVPKPMELFGTRLDTIRSRSAGISLAEGLRF